MSKEDSVAAPVSSAGITSFSVSTGSKFPLDPKLVIAFAFGFIVVEIIFSLIF